MTTTKEQVAYRLADTERALLKDKVMAHQNDGLIAKYCYEMNVSNQEAQTAFTELKKFLFICGTTDEKLTPSIALDDIWHQFILFTKSYMNFCNEYFGRMIHHLPDVEFNQETKKANNLSYAKTCEIAEMEFGKLNADYWMNPNFVNTAKCSGDDAGTSGCNSKCANCGKCSNQ